MTLSFDFQVIKIFLGIDIVMNGSQLPLPGAFPGLDLIDLFC